MVNLVTGMTGVEHVTSDDERIRNYACFGKGINYVIDVGEKFRAEKISNNTVRVHSGTLITQGTQMEIELGDFVDCHIDNGTIGVNRADTIVFRYEKDANTSLEKATIKVVKGIAVDGVPEPPIIVTGNILDGGDLVHEVALHHVFIKGTEITAINPPDNVTLEPLTKQLMERPVPSEEGANRYLSHLKVSSHEINEADRIVMTSLPESGDSSHFYVKPVWVLFNKVYQLLKDIKISDLWSALKSKATPDMEKTILKNSRKDFPPNDGESLVDYIFRYQQNVMTADGVTNKYDTAITHYGDSVVLINCPSYSEINAVAYDFHNNIKQVCIIWGGGKYGSVIADYTVKEYATTEVATTSKDGLMSKEDKQKIDSIKNPSIELAMLGWTVPYDCPIQNEINGDTFIQKVDRVNLGTLTWTYEAASRNRNMFKTKITNIKTVADGNKIPNIKVNEYRTVSYNASWVDKDISLSELNSKTIVLVNNNYTDSSSFKSAVNNLYLYYELETPITKQISGNEVTSNLDIKVKDQSNFNELIPSNQKATYFLAYASHENAPNGFYAGFVEVLDYNGTCTRQIAYSYDSSDCWTRVKIDNSWSSWSKLNN